MAPENDLRVVIKRNWNLVKINESKFNNDGLSIIVLSFESNEVWKFDY